MDDLRYTNYPYYEHEGALRKARLEHLPHDYYRTSFDFLFSSLFSISSVTFPDVGTFPPWVQITYDIFLYVCVSATVILFVCVAISPSLLPSTPIYQIVSFIRAPLFCATLASLNSIYQYLYFVIYNKSAPYSFLLSHLAEAAVCLAAFYTFWLLLKHRRAIRLHFKKRRRLRRLKIVLARKKMEAEAAARKTVLVTATKALALAPLETMYLKLKRSQRYNILGSAIFILDARMEVPAGARQYIYTYGLGGRLVYESEERQRHRERALDHSMAAAGAGTGLGWTPSAGQVGKSVLKTAWKLGRAGVSAARAAIALRITINSLLNGVHIECPTMEELLDAENQIRGAAHSLKAYIDTAKTFSGTEEIVEL